MTIRKNVSSEGQLSPRRLAVKILDRIDKERGYAEPLLNAYLSIHEQEDQRNKNLLTQIVFGTLRMRGYLDWIIRHYYRGTFDEMDISVKNILRTALFQIFFLDRLPPYAVVNESVALVSPRRQNQKALVNGLLRNVLRTKEQIPWPDKTANPALYIAVHHSHPLWLVERWIALFGEEETLKRCASHNTTPPAAIRVNSQRISRQDMITEMRHEGWNIEESPCSPDGIHIIHSEAPLRDTAWFKEGKVQFQDEGSQLIAYFLRPRPGEKILDLCAGTGGKATHMAALMGDQGSILAVDNQRKKLDSLQEMAHRLGITCIKTLCQDGRTTLPCQPESFDAILVDVPCTGLGTLRRNPEIKWHLHPTEISKIVSLQKDLLENAAIYLRKGGRLVYSTCTILSEENDDQVASFLERHREFRQERHTPHFSSFCLDEKGFMKTAPHRHNMDAFFAALLTKVD
ncbi:MAG: 16S rRNA (cytosine(967)-C(5))-methyltransferase RsmB [Syntrophobacterales bacterium]|jgi:16S rRNA (cytosine967-C5)-methyltransferase|nr:16S rRNA (cytosine(967)-C(5))-methyltransferase RsmB [Syntrophobacterales bacterium]